MEFREKAKALITYNENKAHESIHDKFNGFQNGLITILDEVAPMKEL